MFAGVFGPLFLLTREDHLNFKEMNIKAIREAVDALPMASWGNACRELSMDLRPGVQRLGAALQRKLEKYELETLRLEQMAATEMELAGNAALICGIDEAGRGPLAGPVVAAAVILPDGFIPWGLNDSKKITEAGRDRLYDEIIQHAVTWGVGMAEPECIDRINILEATREAMLGAIAALDRTPDFVLLDAVEIKTLTIPHRGIIKGDEKCLSIAAASIIAKVTRDRLMADLGRQWPQYGFEIHKGYGTMAHYEALRVHGPSPHHRKSFLKNWKP